MNKKEVYKLLTIILEKLSGKSFDWYIHGSVNLLIHGIDLNPNDLDIVTTDKGIEIFRSSFEGYFNDKYGEKVNGRLMIFKIDDKEVEIISNKDKKLNKFEKVQLIEWKGLKVPIIPLIDIKDLYQRLERKKRVNLINAYINGKNENGNNL